MVPMRVRTGERDKAAETALPRILIVPTRTVLQRAGLLS